MRRLESDTLALKASSLEWLHTPDISSKATGATNWAKEGGAKKFWRVDGEREMTSGSATIILGLYCFAQGSRQRSVHNSIRLLILSVEPGGNA